MSNIRPADRAEARSADRTLGTASKERAERSFLIVSAEGSLLRYSFRGNATGDQIGTGKYAERIHATVILPKDGNLITVDFEFVGGLSNKPDI